MIHIGRYQKTPASSAYKSQRRNRIDGKKKKQGEGERKEEKTEGGTA
jgi:hypothetical protein